jgi:hypothetical protein
MADSQDKQTQQQTQEKHNQQSQDGTTLLKILDEKDKLIVSLKESSTKRDKLNETQIRMLSEDLHQKSDLLTELRQKIKDTEYDALRKESELSIYKITNDKINERLGSLKSEILAYKDGIASELVNLKDLITKELGTKDGLAKAISDEMRGTITKLETKVKEVEDYYLGILKNLSAKQGAAKKLVREAIDTLQDALNYLDIGNLDLYKPKHIEQEFQQVIDSSRKSISEKEESIRSGGAGDTVIKNIENVNIRLMQSPKLENIFSDIGGLSANARKELQALQRGMAGGGGGEQNIGKQNEIFGDKNVSQKGGGKEAGGKGAKPAGAEGAEGGKGDEGEGKKDKGDKGDGEDGGGPEGAKSDGSLEELIEAGQRFGQEDGDPLKMLMEKENFAPFDWMKILNDMQLRKYSDLIKVCNKAIKEGNYTKAVKLFRTIREQPGIQEAEITTKMIDEEIEFLEKIVKDKYTRKPS